MDVFILGGLNSGISLYIWALRLTNAVQGRHSKTLLKDVD